MAGLSNVELDRFMKGRRLWRNSKWLGALAADQLPPITVADRPCCLIVNTSALGEGGSGHWEAMHFGANDGFFYDSYGLQPGQAGKLLATTDSFKQFMSQNAGRWTDSSYDMQSLGSAVCGQYSALFCVAGPPSIDTPVWDQILTAPNSAARDHIVSTWFSAAK